MKPQDYTDFHKIIFIFGLMLYSLIITGCATSEGGSSLPWSQPEPWETQVLPSMEE